MKPCKLLFMIWLCSSMAACATDEAGGDESAQSEPAVTAADTKPDVPLRNTYWKLVELNGGPVQPGEGKELHMTARAGCARA
jgi:hypothetical protein